MAGDWSSKCNHVVVDFVVNGYVSISLFIYILYLHVVNLKISLDYKLLCFAIHLSCLVGGKYHEMNGNRQRRTMH